jgi:hypothetical protein
VPDELNNVLYATAHGLLMFGFANEPQAIEKSGSIRGMWKRIETWISSKF